MKKGSARIPEKVIVELILADLDFRRDAELPTQMPIEDIREGLLTLLREREPKKFSKIKGITIAFRGKQLPDDTTLAAVGAWDGSTLELGKVSAVPTGNNVWMTGG